MSKHIMQDITSRSADARPTLKKRIERKWEYAPKSNSIVDPAENAGESQPYQDFHDGGDRSEGRSVLARFKVPIIWSIIIAACAVGAFAFSALFASATIDIEVSRQETSIDRELVAYRADGAGDVPFGIVTLTSEVVERVPTTKEENVSRKASGKIVVFNESPNKIDLVVNTRFRSNDGLIYRAPSPVSVPAARDSGGERVPGSLEITVMADQPGSEYNIGMTDFTVPGLEGSDLYEQMYARSKTEMTGGYEGVLRTADDAAIEAAQMTLVERAEQAVRQDLAGAIPSDQVAYDDGLFVTVDTVVPNDVVTDASGATFVPVRGVATLYALVFDRHALSAAIAAKTIPSYDGSPVLVSDLESLTFSLADREAIDPQAVSTLTFVLKGRPFIVWELDVEALRTDLAGLDQNEAEAIVRSKYDESVRRYNAEFSPFWMHSFPKDPNDITITVDDGR